MEYVFFLLTLGLFAWTLPVLYLRFLSPLFARGRAFFSSDAEGRVGRFMKYLSLLLFAGLEAYILSGWTAFCVFKGLEVARLPHTTGWIYMTTAFILCQASLGFIAVRDIHGEFILVLRSVIPMGAFATFAMVPARIEIFYAWLIPFFPGNILRGLFGGFFGG
jgi:hypothetical protein